MAQCSSSSGYWPAARPSPVAVRDIFPDPHAISPVNIATYLEPTYELSQCHREEIIRQFEAYHYGQLGSVIVPICTLAFLQHNDQLFKASVLSTDQDTSQGVLMSRIELLNKRGLLEVFRSANDSKGELHVRIPDQMLKQVLVAWTFSSKSYPRADLANAIFSTAIAMLEEVGPMETAITFQHMKPCNV